MKLDFELQVGAHEKETEELIISERYAIIIKFSTSGRIKLLIERITTE
jgi:hypothetical protein